MSEMVKVLYDDYLEWKRPGQGESSKQAKSEEGEDPPSSPPSPPSSPSSSSSSRDDDGKNAFKFREPRLHVLQSAFRFQGYLSIYKMKIVLE
jgi:hypothetical protein